MGARMASMQIEPQEGAGGALRVVATVLSAMQFTVVPRNDHQFYDVSVEHGTNIGAVQMGPPGFFIGLIVLRMCLAGAESSVDRAIKHRWILERLALGPELHRYPLEARMGARMASMRIEPHEGVGGALRVVATVLNTVQFTVVPRKGINDHQFYDVSVEPGTNIGAVQMGPPGLIETEAELTRGFASVNRWLMLRNGERLLLSGPEVEMILRRAEPRDAGALADILGSQVQAEHELDAALEQLHVFDEHPAVDAVQSRVEEEEEDKQEQEEEDEQEQEQEEEEEEDRLDSAAPLLEELTLLNELGALEADMR
eukprot:CAMPEP_0172781354 /NCGR_PEP_ID=MMETSP1074-20121228/203387_1 /TAXON_ID=2916 /ORGANISM="Ceratium fusus, Strain PA161109" /LENGTH=312 /DNA_ID=CAMNT_0013618331 /DNA_START=200 /DNA_END=1135 /DNA_ORIENTATION=-